MTQIGTVINDQYEILREIGRGGMSTVYLAMAKRLNKQWAIKEIRKKGNSRDDEIFINSLMAETNLLKRLDHPALPRIVDIIDNGATLYVVMDYIEGESLDKILDEYGPQPEELVISWAKQICDALGYLHSQKPPIIYRDMKPANIMLKPEGNIKIIDFGIAREYKELNLSDTTVLGTRGYAPPEQYNGQTDPRSDIFALGMTMHHLLTGVDPRSGEAYASVRMYNPELSEGIEAIIDKCTQPAAERRYQSCSELMYDLEHPELITKGFKRKQKVRLGLFIGAASLAAVMAVSGVVCRLVSDRINSETYEAYISANATDENMDSFKLAIQLFPDDPRGYERVLDVYDDNISARSSEPDNVLLLPEEYNQLEALAPKMAEKYQADYSGFASLYYRIGKLYYTYYNRTLAKNENFRDRVNKAFAYFDQNHSLLADETLNLGFDEQELSECYYQICNFYKRYVFNETADAASAGDYESFFSTLNGLLDSIESNPDATAYDRLELYDNIFMLLYGQRSDMVTAGCDMGTVLDLMDRVKAGAEGIDPGQRTLWIVLRNEVLDNYGSYRSAVERAYSNAERRG